MSRRLAALVVVLILLGGAGLAYALSKPSHHAAGKDIARLVSEPDVFTQTYTDVVAPMRYWSCQELRAHEFLRVDSATMAGADARVTGHRAMVHCRDGWPSYRTNNELTIVTVTHGALVRVRHGNRATRILLPDLPAFLAHSGSPVFMFYGFDDDVSELIEVPRI